MSSGFGRGPIPGMQGSEEPAQRKYNLRLLTGPATGREFELKPGENVLGRGEPTGDRVDIDLSSCEQNEVPVISRRHAEILVRDARVELRDLGSRNGTWLGGQRLDSPDNREPSSPRALLPGSRFRLADLEFELVAE
jgi:hypothetical protein